MKFKGTEGEWKVKGHSVYGNHFESSIACLDESLYSINSKELNANAKLIAAAPEMLLALKKIVALGNTGLSLMASKKYAKDAIEKALK